MQLFPRSLNFLPLALAIGAAGAGGAVTFGIGYYFSPSNTQVGYAPTQPVPFSHRLHAGQLGMDCRYCHANIERTAHAMVPATQTCMGCHAQIKKESAALAPVRESWATGRPVEWVRVHKLPDHAYFDHSVHLSAGVGCRSCHGRVDEMPVVRQDQPLSMGWCLDCHRDPSDHIRPVGQITNMACRIGGESCSASDECCSGSCDGNACAELVATAAAREVHPPSHCSGCHR